jgi:CRISPR type IV-associated protein Csf2
MQSVIFEGVVTALTSISHIGDSHGVNSNLRREKIVQPDGAVEEIPVISGNAMRGILRDRGMLHMLKCLGYGVDEETGEVRGLSLPAFYFLFSGGALTKQAGKGIDVDEARRWRSAIPLVALFGGAMGNQIMPGKAKIGKMIPICQETAHLIPEQFITGQEQSVWDLCQEEAYTRRDDEKNERLRQLIAPEVRGLLEASAAAKRAKIGTSEDVAGETGQSQQMRYFVETLAAGTRLYWDVVLDDVTPVEFDAFCITLAEFGRHPYVGGKSGVGHGKVAVKFDQWHEINPRLGPNGAALDVSLGTRYMQHLRDQADTIRELINGLA